MAQSGAKRTAELVQLGGDCWIRRGTCKLHSTNNVQSFAVHVGSRFFLELFAGKGGTSVCIRNQGHESISIDIKKRKGGAYGDLADPAVLEIVRSWMCVGMVAGILLETRCASWSTARKGVAGTPGGPMRCKEHILGVPGLKGIDAQKVAIGNATMMATVRIIETAVDMQIPCLLENPCNSWLWQAPPLVELLGLEGSQHVIFDQCAYRTKWRKRTRIQGWFTPTLHTLRRICIGRSGFCSFTRKMHVRLEGSLGGKPLTQQAEAYPKKMCEDIAGVLLSAAGNEVDR